VTLGAASPRVVLVETSDALPGLLPFQAWDVLGTADVVLLRDPVGHPSAAHLHFAGLDLERLEPATLDRADLDLTRPGAPEDRRMAKALVARALDAGRAVFLLGADDTGIAPALAGMAAERDLEIELVFLAQQPAGSDLLGLVEVVRRLRDPDAGCPWDLEQDHGTLVRHLVEECYELVDAIERDDDVDLREELGDVLLQVLLHARIAADRGAFGIDDVARTNQAKLVHRHPHVFGDAQAATPAEVQANWDRLKAVEKDRDGPFDGVPQAGPGLDLLATLHRKADKAGLAHRQLWDPDGAIGTALRGLLPHSEGSGGEGAGEGSTEQALAAIVDAVVLLAHDLGMDPEAVARTAARTLRQQLGG